MKFVIKDCALIPIATGKSARTLRELRHLLESIEAESIYYHFWGNLLKPRFDDPEFNNDFAAWAKHALHDGAIAEKLAVIDPTDFTDIEDLRHEIIDIIEESLFGDDSIHLCQRDEKFNFITSQILVFNTDTVVENPKELTALLPKLPVSSIFYHFIDARRRTPEHIDDFRAWLSGMNGKFTKLIEELANVDPYFSPLPVLRDRLSEIFADYDWSD
ncbi:MAG TPA: hypothetical protein ENN07_04300 [candidate division Zixibacteria bacterium]|nr:hypothetical protein [candidate division Zixibacteria bacterium]